MSETGGTAADASSVIYLAKCAGFGLLHGLFPVVDIPPAVWREAVVRGQERGAPEVKNIEDAEARGWLRRTELSPAADRAARLLAAAERLGEGESQVIAVTDHGQRCVLDERRGRRVAKERGIRPIPTLVLPVLAWQRKVVGKTEALEFVRAIGVVSGALAESVLVAEEAIEGGRR